MRKKQKSNLEELPVKENNAYNHINGRKTHRVWSRHTGPEERISKYFATLKASVGMKWDEVYSKLKHEFIDILDMWSQGKGKYVNGVYLDCFTKDGKVYTSDGRFRMDESNYHSYRELYVAEDGILRQTKVVKKERTLKKSPIVEFNKLKFVKDTKGIWWQVEVIQIPKEARYLLSTERYQDAFYGSRSGNYLYYKYKELVYIKSRQQCGKRLCKKLNAFTQ